MLLGPYRKARTYQRSSIRHRSFMDALPTEVLSRAFELAAPDIEAGGNISKFRTTLMLVARSWAAVVNSTPRLWTDIDCFASHKEIERSLDLSRGYSLVVVRSIDIGAIHPTIRRLFGQLHRWQNCRLIFSSASAFHLLASPAPRLKALRLCLPGIEESGVWYSVEHGELLDGDAPLLTEISVGGVALPWLSPVLRDLTVLRLESIPQDQPSTEEFIALLEASPHLHTLKLTNIGGGGGDGGPSPDMSSSKRVTLLDLRTLITHGLSTAFWKALAVNVQAPRCVSLKTSADFEPIPRISPLISHHLSTILAGHQYPITIVLWAMEKKLVLELHRNSDMDDDPSSVFEWNCPTYGAGVLTEAIRLSPVIGAALSTRPVKLVLESPILFPGLLNEHVCQLNPDHLVILNGPNGFASSIIQQLSVYIPGLVLFPRLKILELHGPERTGCRNADLKDLLEMRKSVAMPLERLVVHGRRWPGAIVLSALEALVGEGNVEWDSEQSSDAGDTASSGDSSEDADEDDLSGSE